MKSLSHVPLTFSITLSEIQPTELRWDPHFYRPEYFKISERVRSSRWAVKKLGDVISRITKGETPLWRGHEYVSRGIPFLRVQNLKEDGFDLSDLVFITRKVHESMKRSQLEDMDVLYSMAGTIGVATVYRRDVLPEANINQAIARIAVGSSLDPYYLSTFLNTDLGRLQGLRLLTVAAQPNINFEQIRSIEIPVPPIEEQIRIAKHMAGAYKAKEEMTKNANALLDSVSNEVLEKLCISIEIPENPEKTYLVPLSQIEDRIDPYYYAKHFVDAMCSIDHGKYPVKALNEIAVSITGGATPLAKSDAYTSEKEGIPFLRIQNIREDDIDLTDVKYITKEIHNNPLKRSQLKKGDLLFTITGRIGTAAVVPTSLERGNINQHIVKITLNDTVNPYYVSAFLNSEAGNLQAMRRVTGTTRIALDYEAIKTLKIPVPPIRVQEEIAEEVSKRRENAHAILRNAEGIVEETKKSVEKEIVGK